MISTAKLGMIRIAPRKMGPIASLVRGKDINEALTILKFSPAKRTAGVLHTLIKSAVSNATQKNAALDVDKIYVKTIMVGQSATLKRFRPRAKGSASRILKKTSNITVELATR